MAIFADLWRRTPFGDAGPVVAQLALNGVIAPPRRGGGGGTLSLARLKGPIDAAFKPARLAGVSLIINSPGGSPVQSRLIHDYIRAKAAERDVPVFAFVEDVGASGGYILALAADEIYADESSLVGSVGVIAAGFGFPEALSRIGVERRVRTAGACKSRLDPFQPENDGDLARMDEILSVLHQAFIGLVKERRGAKLDAAPATVFEGEVFTAGEGVASGLIDGIGASWSVLKRKFGEKVVVKDIATGPRGVLGRIGAQAWLGRPSDLGEEAVIGVLSTLDERAHWSRFGL